MSVLTDLHIESREFELGRVLAMPAGVTVELEALVPLGDASIPLFWVHNDDNETVAMTAQDHPTVHEIRKISDFEERTLFELEWKLDRDLFFEGIRENEGYVLTGKGTTDDWTFELRFPSHDDLSAFRDYCERAHVDIEVQRVYNPTNGGTGPWFGLTERQRSTLVRAVEEGYYDIPRECTTEDLAALFDISDQAVTERLRRGISTLVENTLMAKVSPA